MTEKAVESLTHAIVNALFRAPDKKTGILVLADQIQVFREGSQLSELDLIEVRNRISKILSITELGGLTGDDMNELRRKIDEQGEDFRP